MNTKDNIKKSISTNRLLDIYVYLTAVLIIVGIIVVNRLLPSELDFGHEVESFNEGWIDQNGNSIVAPTDIPNVNGSVVITNTVPNIENGRFVCIRSSQQDVSILIDGTERVNYSTKDTRIVGKNSASKYVFAELSPDDIGKEIKIVLTTSSMYSGRINEIIIGRSADILVKEFRTYIGSDTSALLLLFLGILGCLLGFMLTAIYHSQSTIVELGMVAVITGLWRLSESRMRQFYFNSNSAMSSIAFVALALLPIFLLRFVDKVTQSRYKKLFKILQIVGLGLLLLETVLQILNIYDYVEMMNVTFIECGIFLAVILGVLITEFKNKNIKHYIFTAIGLFITLLAAIIEICLAETIQKDRILAFISVLVLFLLTSVDEIRRIIDIKNENERKQKEQAETLSVQIVTALSSTVDAKDKYTNGHSSRVATYSAILAKELGWKDEDIEILKFEALLHDVGKIGVPDEVLNKPGKLSDTEFNIIKSHTIVGDDILKDMSVLPSAKQVARHHHERYDGFGYPDKLKGTDIPLNARIVCIADTYDAMSSDRIYRKALSNDIIRNELVKGRGTQFDPELLDIFLKLFDDCKLDISVDSSLFEKSDIDHRVVVDAIEQIVNDFSGNEDSNTASLSYQDYDKFYNYMRSVGERYNRSLEVVAVNLVVKEDLDSNETDFEEASKLLEVSIKKNIRAVDVYFKHTSHDHLIIFLDAGVDNINMIIQRVIFEFNNNPIASKYNIEYLVNESITLASTTRE